MTRMRITAATALAVALASTTAIKADVRADQKTKFQLGGVLGRMVNMFGGRAAREGVTTWQAVKGERKITMGDSTGQIIDLTEEKVYDLDIKAKKYKVTTFAELRRQMEEARARAAEDAKKEQASQTKSNEQEPQKPEKEYEVDFDIKNTGEKKSINGFDTHQAIVTITVREKGKKIEQSGGMIMTSDIWLAPRMASMKELADFNLKYAQKVYGPMVEGASPRDMATALAMYPQIKPALDKMAAEGTKVEGTPILTTVTMDAVLSEEQMAEQQKNDTSAAKNDPTPTTVGGLLGGLARRGAQRSSETKDTSKPSNRATVLTTTNEVLKIATDVSAETVAVPSNFKLDK